jgi:hypothetical protein
LERDPVVVLVSEKRYSRDEKDEDQDTDHSHG